MNCRVTVLPQGKIIRCQKGEKLLSVLQSAGFAVDAPCAGAGKCGKCRVIVDGEDRLSCSLTVEHSMEVVLPEQETSRVLAAGLDGRRSMSPPQKGFLLAFDIGTTTVAGYLLDGITGRDLASESMLNPQSSFGADVISRIRYALQGGKRILTEGIQCALTEMTVAMCQRAGIQPDQIGAICIVGNPAMQQLFLGISPENLARIPFAPVLTEAKYVQAREYIPCCTNAILMIVPDISGFVGADTVACILATGMDRQEEPTLLVDIGTNGEMVLGNQGRMVACSAAAGPALEGADITYGMRGQKGAIDHVWIEDGMLCCSVIGNGAADGICGSGLVDAVAAALELGLLDQRGSIQNEEKRIWLRDGVYLSQADIRQFQMAKGAIAAGIELMTRHLGIGLQEIGKVCLAGAFGTFMDPGSACRTGLLPPVLLDKIVAVGNAALSGAKIMACDQWQLEHAQNLVKQVERIELGSDPDFRRAFARNMRFENGTKMD